jgi:hypothetical protein
MKISDVSRDYGKCTIPKKAYQDCFQKWQWHWEQCVNAGGEYFEGNTAHSVAGMSKKNIYIVTCRGVLVMK